MQDSGCTIAGIKFYGSPWTLPIKGKPVGDWAFQAREKTVAIGAKFMKISQDTDVLVTHMMPWGYGDSLMSHSQPTSSIESSADKNEQEQIRNQISNTVRVGSKLLLNRLKEVNPFLHVFGHFHEG